MLSKRLLKIMLGLEHCDKNLKSSIVLYCVFILSAISPCTTGLKALLTHPTAQVQRQLTSNWHSPNWKIEAQG